MSLRWAARYAFTEDLWQSKPRVVLDAALEETLLEGDLGLGEDGESIEDLLDALLPVEAEGPPVWMGVSDADVATRLRRQRPGTTFVPVDTLADVLAREAWDAALLDLDAIGVEPDDADAFARASAVADMLGLRPSAGRHVVLWGAAALDDDDGRLGYDDLAEVALDRLAVRGSTQRIYGIYRPAIAAVVDFGESLEPDDEPTRDTEITLSLPRDLAVGTGEDDEVPMVFDNTLGSQEPTLVELVAITSPRALPEGLGLVELPAQIEPQARGVDAGMRAQLASAQARSEQAEIERQTLLERVDALQRENRDLRDALETLRAEPAPVVEEAPFDATARDEALEASMAREQALKWKVSALEHQLSRAIARPVEELEAEVARLRARTPTAPASISGDFIVTLDAEPNKTQVDVQVHDDGRDRRLSAQMLGVVQRLERGGISVLELRRDLADMARRLRTR